MMPAWIARNRSTIFSNGGRWIGSVAQQSAEAHTITSRTQSAPIEQCGRTQLCCLARSPSLTFHERHQRRIGAFSGQSWSQSIVDHFHHNLHGLLLLVRLQTSQDLPQNLEKRGKKASEITVSSQACNDERTRTERSPCTELLVLTIPNAYTSAFSVYFLPMMIWEKQARTAQQGQATREHHTNRCRLMRAQAFAKLFSLPQGPSTSAKHTEQSRGERQQHKSDTKHKHTYARGC